ncbi:B9 domain-containing protein 2, partial [Thoreauomyces humboldtii]
MAEVHILGTLCGASDFPSPNLSCKWRIVAGDGWRLLEGDAQGATHLDTPESNVTDRLDAIALQDPRFTVWSHPI